MWNFRESGSYKGAKQDTHFEKDIAEATQMLKSGFLALYGDSK